MRLYGKFPAPLGEISVVNSEIPPRRAVLSYKRKQILTKNLTETRDLGKEASPTNRAGPPPYKHPPNTRVCNTL